jgi:hypothetical protein
MEALIDSGEEWLEPLFEFGEWLAKTIDPQPSMRISLSPGYAA